MKNFKKVLSLMLAAVMVIGAMVVAPMNANAEEPVGKYVRVTDVSTITSAGAEGIEFVIIAPVVDAVAGTTTYYAMDVRDGSWVGAQPVELDANGNITSDTIPTITVKGDASAVTLTTSEGDILAGVIGKNNIYAYSEQYAATNIIDWTVSEDGTSDLFRFYLNGSTESTDAEARYIAFNTESEYLKFRQYKESTITGKGYVGSFMIYVYSDTLTIAEALDAADNTICKVKGVVTMIDGKNVFIQDATGGICVYLSEDPTELEVGDTIEAQGKRGAYRDMPQLGYATYTETTGLTLAAKTTTIGALTKADLGTYVKITGLEVTEIYDNNGAYDLPNVTVSDGTNTIQIYKAVIGKNDDGTWAIKVGDKIDVLAAVGANYEKFQLRNTNAAEITLVVNEPAPTPTPTPTPNTADVRVLVPFAVLGVSALALAVVELKKRR